MFRRKPNERLQPEWIIVGLGNPGGEYDGTRHNVGFEVIRILAERNAIKLDTRRFQSHFGVGNMGETTVALVRPMTYMNLSGQSVATLLRHFNLKPGRLVVVYDDMDLRVGRVQIRPQGGAGSHNGMKNILALLATRGFPRVRIGIGGPSATGIDHVLSQFHRDEIDAVRDAIASAVEGCALIVAEGVPLAMNRINKPEEAFEPESSE
ncbi:MAG: aminoacyl-tRNA hydrolase [Armatimonadetes bacterium]|nr:aminoacyl-tRNA hydrolase [Armatimonadota bacterium]